ncbi:MAG: hypothetical protein ACRDVE_02195, partial [Actinocrinis sp.]
MHSHYRQRGRRVALPAAAVAALALAATAAPPPASADAVPTAGQTADRAQPWQQYNFAPASRTVAPVSVYRTTGTVGNANAVLTG